VNVRRRAGTALLPGRAAGVLSWEESESIVRGDPPVRLSDSGAKSGPGPVQPSGVFTKILLNDLEKCHSTDALTELLRRTGDNRSLEEFKESAGATSIEQFVRLRHEADLLFGAPFG
jgi:hypothetical protein